MVMLNSVVISGTVVADPELKTFENGGKVAKFAIAHHNKAMKDARRKTSFVDVDAWDKCSDFVMKHLKKGSHVIVEGMLEQIKWKNRTGGFSSKLLIKSENVQRLDFSMDDDNIGGEEEGAEQAETQVIQPEQSIKPRAVAPEFGPAEENETGVIPF